MATKEERRAKLEELLGEMFDQLRPRDIQQMTIGQQADRQRHRERFQKVGLELARELVRSLRDAK